MTDNTYDRDRPCVDGENKRATTSGGHAERPPKFDRADSTPGGTADATQSSIERPTATDQGEHPGEESSVKRETDPNDDRLEERLRAVERALTGTDDAVADLGDEASASAEREELSTRLDDLEARVAELEAATQAVRGYVGSIRSVNQAVERRADLALAKASENDDTLADDKPTARGDTAADESDIDDTFDGDSLGANVPSEAELDAAVPTDHRRKKGTESAIGTAIDRTETDGENADSTWRADALDRLRDTL